MACEEGEELAEVAPIGLDRMGGELALGHEIDEPGVDRAVDIGRGAERFRFRLDFDFAADFDLAAIRPSTLPPSRLLWVGESLTPA